MPFEKNRTSLASACAPTAGSTQSNQHNARVWSPTQMGPGVVGTDARTISCVFEQLTDQHGNFRGAVPYLVLGEIQTYPPLSVLLKSTEYRAAVTIDQITGLIYRKLPASNGFGNSWLDSAETAMHALVGNWGRISSDRQAGMYRFEALNLPGRPLPHIPDVDDLIDELLADFVIDSLDHPALQRLLNPVTPPAQSRYEASAALDIEEDNNEVY